MDNLIQRFESLKTKRDSLDKQITQEEASFNTLKDQYKHDLIEFCKKYNVKTLDEAKALLQSKEKELQEKISKAEQALNVFSIPSSNEQFPDLNL